MYIKIKLYKCKSGTSFLFLLMCMCALPANMSVHYMYAWCMQRTEGFVGSPETGILSSCELLCMSWEFKPHPLEELLMTKPCLQPLWKAVIKTFILFHIQKIIIVPGKVINLFNSNTQEAEARRSLWVGRHHHHLHIELQDSQDYINRVSKKKPKSYDNKVHEVHDKAFDFSFNCSVHDQIHNSEKSYKGIPCIIPISCCSLEITPLKCIGFDRSFT